MYDTIMEKIGPGPITQSLVDLWEKPIEPSPEDKDNHQVLKKKVRL